MRVGGTPIQYDSTMNTTSMDTIAGILPGGYLDETGVAHRDVKVSPLSGSDEELLCASGSDAAAVTAILSRCVQRVGDVEPISEDLARNLLVADRLYLLLKLREATFGQRVQATKENKSLRG